LRYHALNFNFFLVDSGGHQIMILQGKYLIILGA
jgi:hypothetical protein